ncbi:hypothetical protein ON010_g18209 [Phytophthora cinnamomi]|nr:hypothetical protein ON010_g18209 [Phytophthora cinnamomi]
MEGFDQIRVRNALDIPDRYGVPVVIALGYPNPTMKPKRPSRGTAPLAAAPTRWSETSAALGSQTTGWSPTVLGEYRNQLGFQRRLPVVRREIFIESNKIEELPQNNEPVHAREVRGGGVVVEARARCCLARSTVAKLLLLYPILSFGAEFGNVFGIVPELDISPNCRSSEM